MSFVNLRVARISAFVACLALADTAGVQAAQINFSLIAEGDSSQVDFSLPAINNSGTVAFSSGEAGGNLLSFIGTGVYSGNGGPLTTIADTTNNFDFFTGFPSINNSGLVAFSARSVSGPSGIFAGSGGSVTPLVLPGGVVGGTGIYPAISDSGTVAFLGNTNTGARAIFIAGGGTTTAITEIAGPLTGSSAPTISSSGQTAFYGSDDNGFGIFAVIDGKLTEIARAGGTLTSFGAGFPSINSQGTTAFQGGRAVFTGNGDTVTMIADNSGAYDLFGSGVINSPSINDSGLVAFHATLDEGGAGIFTGPDPFANKLIATGDSLFGSTVEWVDFGPYGLSENGYFAFRARLDDGRLVIARGQIIPEPASIIMLSIGGLGLVGYGWIRCRRDTV